MGVSLVCVFSAVGIFYGLARKSLMNEVRDQIRSIVVTAADLIDWQGHNTLTTAQDMNSPVYHRIRQEMEKIIESNQGHGLHIKYAYTLRPVPHDPRHLEFVIDTDNTKERQKIGDEVADTFEDDVIEHMRTPFVTKKALDSPWGWFISGYAPIFDKKGNYIATLGIDVYEQEVKTILDQLIIYGLYALAISILVSGCIAMWLSRRVTNSLAVFTNSARAIGEGRFDEEISIESNDEFKELAVSLRQMESSLKERERMICNFSKYVSDTVFDKVLHNKDDLVVDGERRKVTVLFTDLGDFLKASEGYDPQRVVAILNKYFEQMLRVIFKFNGTLDRFTGDGMMVVYGAPIQDGAQEDNAIRTALEMQKVLGTFNEQNQAHIIEPMKMGIGIHTGEAVVGNIGSDFRQQYTAVGQTIEIANAIESETKRIGKSILLSQSTYRGSSGTFKFNELPKSELIGIEDQIVLYELQDN